MGSNEECELVGVTQAAESPLPVRERGQGRGPVRSNAPVPTLTELARDYRRRGDGCVTLYDRPQRVTHPITSFGMECHPATGTDGAVDAVSCLTTS